MTCFSLFSGSSGNCIYVEDKGTRLLIDAGCSLKRITEALSSIGRTVSDLDAILVTHEHSDHTKALPLLTKHFALPVYCQQEVAKKLYLEALERSSTEAAGFAKVVRTVEPGMEYEIGNLLVSPFKTPHDSVDSQGFVFGERELGVATDLGHVSQEVKNYLLGCKSVVLESNYDVKMLFDGPYPPYLKERVASENGHLNNEDAASFVCRLVEAGCESVTLFHLSQENNTPQVALATHQEILGAKGVSVQKDLILTCAARHEVTQVR